MVCYNCFREKSSYGPCPFCGYDPSDAEKKYPLALKPGSILNVRYIVGRVIGQGGFGITYIAQDYQTKERVAIKEYFPSEFAGRSGAQSSIQVHSEDQKENFEYGKAQFLQEAKTLAAFIGDEHIVRIYSYFEENNTAYFVMEYVDGYALDKYMAQKGGRLSVDEATRLLLPLMQSLDKVHAKGIIHRDIAPDNIIITKDGTAKLIDFGAARYSTGEKSKSLDVILKHGFAPKEQYMRRGRQGPFTDIYALAATYYYAITGKVPPDAIERTEDDNLFPPSSLGIKIPEGTEDALFKALEVNASRRYQSMHDFYQDMASGSGYVPGSVSEQKAAGKETDRIDSTAIRTEQEAKERAERLERELREAKEEAARLEQERKERESREEAARLEQERKEREAREEAARLERERKEREAKEAEERRKKELAEKKAREEAERQEKLRIEREKREEEKRLAAEKKAREEAERQEKLRIEREKREEEKRLAVEKKAREEAERQEKLRLEREKREEEKRLAAERKKKEAEEKERLRQESIAKRKAEQEQQRLEAERQKKECEEQKAREKAERQEKLRLEREKREEEKRLAAEKKQQDVVARQAEKTKSASKKKPLVAIIAAVLIAAVAIGYFVTSGAKKPATVFPAAQQTQQPAPSSEQIAPTEQIISDESVAPEVQETPEEQTAPAEQETPEEQTTSDEPGTLVEPATPEEQNASTEQETPEEEAKPEEQPTTVEQIEQPEQVPVEEQEPVESIKTAADYYAEGLACKEAREWGNAEAAFELAEDYQDAADQLQSIRQIQNQIQNLSDTKIGDSFFFGSYEQDNDLSNGKEPIEWIVLFQEDNRLMAISKYALDSQPFNTVSTDVTWESCTLREWLNEEFLNNAFSQEDQSLIPEAFVRANPNTTDQVFLLNEYESLTMRFLGSDYFQSTACIPTAYAITQGCLTSTSGGCKWWLRPDGETTNHNGFTPAAGKQPDVSFVGGGVRPSIWIDYSDNSNTSHEQEITEFNLEKIEKQNDMKTVGSIVTFGNYEQDNDLSNGKEPIEWIVLDVQDGRSLLVSRYGLYSEPADTRWSIDYIWETSTLRTWLNKEFLSEAFSEEEQERIPTVTITADPNPYHDTHPGKVTSDQVFLLSVPEVKKFFSSDAERQCVPTEYAKAKGCYVYPKLGTCAWWLRTPGIDPYTKIWTMYVDEYGSLYYYLGTHCDERGLAVRPAIWVENSASTDIDAEPVQEKSESENALAQNSLMTVGNIVTFGNYEQDNDLTNGKEPIEWIVLDVKDEQSLLISKYGLDCQRYHNSQEKVTWETSSLRSWLNSSFQSDAFNSEELERIQRVTVGADENPKYDTDPGNDTIGRIFLLSIPEVNQYFSNDTACQCEPTEYARAMGCTINSELDTCWWWLRSPGLDSNHAAGVGYGGSVDAGGSYVSSVYYVVRPAMWVNNSGLPDEEHDSANEPNNPRTTLVQGDLQTVGNIVTFGSYEQDDDLTNGKEPIEWIILDAQDGKSMLISKNALDYRSYHSVVMSITWETCDLRAWLNNEFLSEAFSANEQERIPTVTVSTDRNPNYVTSPGNETQDQVFVLSVTEAKNLFSTNEERKCETPEWAKSQGYPIDYCFWWLRTPGGAAHAVAVVNNSGSFFDFGSNVADPCFVRPAIWVNWE